MDKQTADGIITEYLQKIYGFAIKKSYSYHEAEEICAEIIKETYLSLLKAREIANIYGASANIPILNMFHSKKSTQVFHLTIYSFRILKIFLLLSIMKKSFICGQR